MKTTITQMKYLKEELSSKLDIAEERISELSNSL